MRDFEFHAYDDDEGDNIRQPKARSEGVRADTGIFRMLWWWDGYVEARRRDWDCLRTGVLRTTK